MFKLIRKPFWQHAKIKKSFAFQKKMLFFRVGKSKIQFKYVERKNIHLRYHDKRSSYFTNIYINRYTVKFRGSEQPHPTQPRK